MSFIEQNSKTGKSPSPGAATEHANYFAFFAKPTPENLAANHSGVLSAQQQKAVETMIAHQRSTLAVVGGMLVLAALFMGYLFWKIDASDGALSINAQLINTAVLLLLGGLFAGLYIGDSFVFFIGDDLTNGAVEASVGRVEWSGKRYRMRAGDRLLRSLRSGVALPPPGDYRFYYLPFTGLVVMAEELRGGQADDPASVLLRALAGANRFSQSDLKLNREGVLAAKQEGRLLVRAVLSMVVLLAGAALLVSMSLQISYLTSRVTFLLLLIIAVVLMLRVTWSGAMTVADLWNGKVASVDGPVTRDMRHSRYGRSYYYVIDTHRFQVSEAAYHALIEGNSYRVYYVLHSQQLVSIEPL